MQLPLGSHSKMMLFKFSLPSLREECELPMGWILVPIVARLIDHSSIG